jgi:hypothetical protein
MRKLYTPTKPINPVSTDDLLHLLTVMVRKAEREPATASKSLQHARRAFDVIVERVS